MSDHTIRLEDGGPLAWSSADGLRCSQDEPYITGLPETRAMHLVENGPFEHAEPDDAEPDPTVTVRIDQVLSGTIEDLEDALQSGEFDGHLDRLEAYEEDHKDRSGAYDAIEDYREDN